MNYVRTTKVAEIREKGRVLFRHDGFQLALFAVGEDVHAVDNRCPHEGYPLLQGSVDEEKGLLTCQWHHWKFDLTTGECVLGEDHVRRYPTRIVDGYLEVDVTPPTLESVRADVLRGLDGALADRQYGRIAREISRLLVAGIDPLLAVRRAIELTYDRFELGTTHAFAALADWLALYDAEGDTERKIVCLTEALDHIADDALRQPSFPFDSKPLRFEPEEFLDAIEREDEPGATARMRGALDEGRSWADLEPVLASAALAHYNDFGHAAIYVLKTGSLLERLAGIDPRYLLLPLTRRLCYSTREDLLPDFRPYAVAAAQATSGLGEGGDWLDGAPLSGKNVKEALAWTGERLVDHRPEVVYSALLEAGAINLLRFDEALQDRATRTVSQNVGWLDFTHAVTFGNAVRSLCQRHPGLWPKGLLQMACFVGRNKRFLRSGGDPPSPETLDPATVGVAAREKLFDHGLAEPIYSAHLVKMLVATETELPHVSPRCATYLAAAVDRFFAARIKAKHPLRTARQALALIQT
jgi:nitrite reductase/ring-hydroxylating ferredoxin subunit